MKALVCNIRFVRSQHAFQRVQMLHNVHKFVFVALLEPFQPATCINRNRKRLRMPKVAHNNNGKIWVFTNHGYDITTVSDTDQQLTVLLIDQNDAHNFYATLVYAECDTNQGMELWDDLYQLYGGMDRLCLIVGDFNVVLNRDEKIGGLPIMATDYEDFKTCIESCDLNQVQFKGSPFTWSNYI